ncbi:hypothetical protein MUB24_14605 [Lederbergia sp. NSJ-179]|uniref:hypothetical protein n=1 Tax=Lederbergia sp. NSJ-179 TaxID=2931402 RepID=UPI001FD27ACA|nr:hypothetical protein [Lederbergia sp. NSJ-179]MCJ7842112.1 hypothetical protein [Lederbergia sp. NSJ-179]
MLESMKNIERRFVSRWFADTSNLVQLCIHTLNEEEIFDCDRFITILKYTKCPIDMFLISYLVDKIYYMIKKQESRITDQSHSVLIE